MNKGVIFINTRNKPTHIKVYINNFLSRKQNDGYIYVEGYHGRMFYTSDWATDLSRMLYGLPPICDEEVKQLPQLVNETGYLRVLFKTDTKEILTLHQRKVITRVLATLAYAMAKLLPEPQNYIFAERKEWQE